MKKLALFFVFSFFAITFTIGQQLTFINTVEVKVNNKPLDTLLKKSWIWSSYINLFNDNTAGVNGTKKVSVFSCEGDIRESSD